jgi:hypothetical protein
MFLGEIKGVETRLDRQSLETFRVQEYSEQLLPEPMFSRPQG